MPRSDVHLRVAVACASLVVALTFAHARADAARPPSLRSVLAGYTRAMADPGAVELAHVQTLGTLSGEGLTGTFGSWQQGDDERTDEMLGPRVERTLRVGNRLLAQDANGDVRQLTGVLARRDLTQRFIDSGEFARHPERLVFLGETFVDGRPAYALDVTADGGETETLYLDAVTYLPLRVAYDDDDGRTTVDLADWRTIGGHRFAFKSVESDGDRAFDVTQLTTSISLDVPIDPAQFAPFVPRAVDLPAAVTLPLEVSEGHIFAPVRIAGRTYRFLIDSGSQDIVIDAHVAAQLGLRPVGAIEASGATRTGGLQVARLSDLEVGGAHFRNLVVSTIDLGASTEGAFRIDGILGYPFFAQTMLRLDIANRTMTIGAPGSLPVAGDRIAIDLDRLFPEAQFGVDRSLTEPFIVDTGSAAEVLLYKPFVEKHAGIVPFKSADRSSYGIGGETRSYLSALDEIDLGDTPIYHADADVMLANSGAFADRFDAGNVGLGVLKNFIVTFDYASGAMYLEHGASFDDGRMRV
jgi:hypothetical protein